MPIQDRLGVRLFNAIGGSLRRMGGKQFEFHPDLIEAAARRRGRVSEFGAPRYREPLAKLCESYESDSKLTFLGRAVCFRSIQHSLENRGRVQECVSSSPAINDERVAKPLFVVGLQRTGTTYLYNLLSQDPSCRPLLYWESMCPAPSPVPEAYATDPRVGKAKSQVRRLNRALPAMAGIHPFVHDGPEECLGLLMNTLLTPFFQGPVPQYLDWLRTIDDSEIDAAYREYEQQLQLLQWKVKRHHWLLKCPSHWYGLGSLLRVFPDAAVVTTHRDIAKCVPSFCSFIQQFETLLYQSVDKKAIGDQIVEKFKLMITRGLQGRDSVGEDRVFDLCYADLVRAPRQSVREIYDRFGYEYTDEFDRRIEAYFRSDPHRKAKLHRYTAEEYGLSSNGLREAFSDYLTRFEIPAES